MPPPNKILNSLLNLFQYILLSVLSLHYLFLVYKYKLIKFPALDMELDIIFHRLTPFQGNT